MKIKELKLFVCVLCILLPMLLLAYFSFTSLQDDNYLLAKGIEDRVNPIATGLNSIILNKFDSIAACFRLKTDKLMNNAGTIAPEPTEELKKLSIETYFIIDRNFNLINPASQAIDSKKTVTGKESLSRSFSSSIEEILKTELAGNPARAVRSGEKLLESNLNPHEKAILLNILARCCSKAANKEQALKYYQMIVKDIPEASDINGVPLELPVRMQIAALHMNSGHIEEAIDNYRELLNVLLRQGRIDRHMLFFYCQEIKTQMQKELKGERTGSYADLKLQIDRTLNLLGYLERINEDDFLRISESGKIRFSRLDGNHLSAIGKTNGTADGNNILCIIIDKSRFIDSLSSDISAKFAYSGDFEFQITSPDGNIVLASSCPLKHPQKTTMLPEQFPAWTTAIEVSGVELLKSNIEKQKRIRMTTLAILLLISTLSIFMVIRTIMREKELALLKTNFVSSVSHEMRLPLSTIMMIGEMFKLGRVNDPKMADNYYSILNVEAARLTRLINRVLDFSRMDSGRHVYKPQKQDLSAVISEAIRTFSSLTEVENGRLETNIENGLSASADADGIMQIILNLLDNALKYSPDGSKIKVNAFSEKDTIVLEVIDCGIGMKKSVIDKIFDPFYRAENELTRERSGVGIGLAIVKYIVDAHNGKIKVESEDGKGTKFSVIIPLMQEKTAHDKSTDC